jgi:hypothetical protein
MLPFDPHEEFRELCALSVAGELTTQEWTRLTEHLAHCAECHELLDEHERLAGTVLPAMAAEMHEQVGPPSISDDWSCERAGARLMESLRVEADPAPLNSPRVLRAKPWREVRRYAIAALMALAVGAGGYWFGVIQGRTSAPAGSFQANRNSAPARSAEDVRSASRVESVPNPDADRERGIREQLRRDQLELARLHEQLNQAKTDLAQRSAAVDLSRRDEADLSSELSNSKANQEELESKLKTVSGKFEEDTAQLLALKAQVQDLNSLIAAKDTEIARQDALMQHDRDIRNLIGARNLYIAEVYDVAKNGSTQKPFGRVFYTKDKSLVFYGYDLDHQKDLKEHVVFQAWGRRGLEQAQDVNLGLLYQDDANQKRWVLKFNDAKAISQLDAVFITAEPQGGSVKPSGKPLLFTYLRLDPNHP